MESQEIRELLNGWTPPVELRRSTPREVRLTRGGVAVLIVAALMVIGSLVEVVLLGRHIRRIQAYQAQLLVEGRDTEGVVSRLWHNGGRDEKYWVAYHFTANDRDYEGRSTVSRSHWRNLQVGSPIAVRYLESQPGRNSPTADPPKPIPWWVPYAFAGGLWFAAIVLPWKVRRQRKLLEEGKPAPGVVRKTRRVYDTHGATTNYVSYEFALAGGGTAKGRTNSGRRPPAPGSVICVLYDPDNPRRNGMYPMCMVRIDRD